MVYVHRGQIIQGPRKFGLHTIVDFFKSILELLIFFFKTILDPKAVDEYSSKKKKSSGGSISGNGGKPGGGGPPSFRGPRIAGLANLKDAGGECAAGA